MRKSLVHFVVWMVLTYFLFFSFSLFLPVSLALQRALTGALLLACMFYISGWVLTDQFLIKRKQWGLFVVFALLLCIVISVLRVRLLGLFPETFPSPFGGEFSKELIRSRPRLFPGRNLVERLGAGRPSYMISFLMNAVALIIASLFRLYEHKAQKEQESREQLQRSQEAQILYLKSQVNPHFLFTHAEQPLRAHLCQIGPGPSNGSWSV